MLLFWTAHASAAACEQATTSLDVERRVAKVEQAFVDIDSVALRQAQQGAREALTCLGEVLTPGLAGRFHRAEALAALDTNNRGLAEQAFASARAVEPAFVLPAVIATETVLEVYQARDPEAGATQSVPPPKVGQVLLDGLTDDRRPLERPVVLQRLGAKGEVIETTLLLPGQALPTWEVKDPGTSRRIRTTLVVGGGAGLLGAAALYGGALAVKEGAYADAVDAWNETGAVSDREEAEAAYATNHGLVVGAGALAVLGLAAATVGLAVTF